jgi:hypothetical protein
VLQDSHNIVIPVKQSLTLNPNQDNRARSLYHDKGNVRQRGDKGNVRQRGDEGNVRLEPHEGNVRLTT